MDDDEEGALGQLTPKAEEAEHFDMRIPISDLLDDDDGLDDDENAGTVNLVPGDNSNLPPNMIPPESGTFQNGVEFSGQFMPLNINFLCLF